MPDNYKLEKSQFHINTGNSIKQGPGTPNPRLKGLGHEIEEFKYFDKNV